ncbi:hypothetical protein D020_4699A, partial [Vibrio parahaemolyticus SBR10290]
MAIPCVISA